MFSDRDSWFNHELKHHHSVYMCKLCGIQYTATKMLQQHILGEHGAHSDEEVLSLIEHGKLVPSQLKAQGCPFCDDWASILSHRRHQTEGLASSTIHQADILVSLTHFKRHVATHQEQLAIFAVPRTVDDDEEHSHGAVEANSEAVWSQDDSTRITDKKPQTMEDSTPSQPCVYVTGLPRAVSEDDIEYHFRRGGFDGIREVNLMDDFALVQLEDPDDVLLVIASMHGSTLMGARINVLRARLSIDQETHVVEEPHADNFDPVRAIHDINAADSHFRTTLLPICEEFIASPPANPQQRQDQSTHIVTIIRHEVWSKVNFIEAHNNEEVMARKTQVLEVVDDMLERIRAVAIMNRRDADIEAQDGNQAKFQPPADMCRVKLYKLHDNDWEDQGTGYCIAKLSETTNDRKEAHIIMNSEEDPGRLILKERVYDGNNFQRQQETLIVWTQRQTGLDMALSFQEATDLDRIWKVIDAVQRDITEDLHVTEAHPTEKASQVTNIDDISIHPSSFRQDIIDAAMARQHESPEDDQTAEDSNQQEQRAPEMIRFRTIAQEESNAYQAQRFESKSQGIPSEDNDRGARQETTKGEVEGEVNDDGNVIETQDRLFCLCNRASFGDMIACDNDDVSHISSLISLAKGRDKSMR